MRHRLDLFGVLVLAFAAGNSGGIARDVMIGAVPPAALSDWRYVAVSILAGLITFFRYRLIDRLSSPVPPGWVYLPYPALARRSPSTRARSLSEIA